MTTSTIPATFGLSTGKAGMVRLVGVLGIIGGILLLVVGGLGYGTVSSQLGEENITVAEDASFLAGAPVVGPFSAFAQADIINHRAMKASGGKTYAQLEQDDPTRPTVMTASLLRASLFTSILAFGVSVFATAIGVLVGLFGWSILTLVPARSKTTTV
ncbi:aromatic ring-opening dioxygenase LigA [Cryobacterium sp. TMT1-21]|uniref:Aromatic ring-opening dioxygenase LigA n=1 Tax=Cryobacterium shii TaxID=1259235 RepID=A0AAQ2C8D0_9MICO|nr:MULTISPECIES: aromatic ring-opening dioxygenase LigA [Cryobacterium]TFC52172.1 aromatic ring-opening dioxygenase LigA [Cryobacterium shii]TFC84725.1 aromatic ring-opening dioxygenase LigA [Cryobacterium sp. TmT2-59]TFD14550.1 aromatic ring-opening dioxygenase LigA [Cryobacterium sp. TMT4-10]TFD15701.1 aromatic ring-opening dioxygenase LigA [Cryobacterium sp. TMT1-21]TFD19000.1 aromatic ring-opening dioxygenase LigA [Cryobacterium sp. TMT2-23]